jgi:large subunit ribosomal protein L18
VSVFRSAAHIRVQLIDDVAGKTLVAVTDEQLKAIPKDAERTGKVAKAYAVGQALAEGAKAKKITAVVFDRAGYRYHGRVRALAEGARAGGLTF